MDINTKRLRIRDFMQDDKEPLYKMIWQENVVKFMRDWSENTPNAESLTGFINYMRTKSNCLDININKRYGVELRETNQLIGMIGMGLEDTLQEVELAYFIGEEYLGNNFATEVLTALFDWCMLHSELNYMILTIDEANVASCRVAEKAGFERFERRTPINHKQPNMVSESYFYFRKYREVK